MAEPVTSQFKACEVFSLSQTAAWSEVAPARASSLAFLERLVADRFAPDERTAIITIGWACSSRPSGAPPRLRRRLTSGLRSAIWSKAGDGSS